MIHSDFALNGKIRIHPRKRIHLITYTKTINTNKEYVFMLLRLSV